jgi:hypothetical protein
MKNIVMSVLIIGAFLFGSFIAYSPHQNSGKIGHNFEKVAEKTSSVFYFNARSFSFEEKAEATHTACAMMNAEAYCCNSSQDDGSMIAICVNINNGSIYPNGGQF